MSRRSFFRDAIRIIRLAALGAAATPVIALGVVPEYSILDLGTLGGPRSDATSLNNAGMVAGWAEISAGARRAFITSANSPINPTGDELPLLPGATAAYAYGINASASVAGVTATLDGDRAFTGSKAVGATNLGTLGGAWAYAYGINDAGQVVGGAATSPMMAGTLTIYPTHAFIYDGTLHDIGTLGGHESYAQAINSSGQVVGYSQLVANPFLGYSLEHAFVWTPNTPSGTSGTMQDLGTLGGGYSYAFGINDTGDIVGGASTLGDLEYHAFLREGSGTSLLDLGTLGGPTSEARAINSLRMVVGNADNASNISRPFLWFNGAMQDLNDVLTPGSGWTLTAARDINDLGQIVGTGTNSLGQQHGFLLTPLPTWQVDADGSWTTASNWFGGVPSGSGAEVRLTSAITLPRAVTVDAPATVGRIIFDNAAAYTLSGSNAITFSGTPGSTGIQVRTGTHTIEAPMRFGNSASITLDNGAGLRLAGVVSGSIRQLSLGANATLDLVANDLIIDYDAADGSPVTAVLAAVQMGRNGGAWDGSGITSSAAAADPNKTKALGVAEAATLGISSFKGQPVDATTVLISYTFGGDTNLDGQVDISDLGRLASSWQSSGTWIDGDFNYDGFIDISDLGALASNWQAGVTDPASLGEAMSALALPADAGSVPEPGACVLAVCACIAMSGRSRSFVIGNRVRQ